MPKLPGTEIISGPMTAISITLPIFAVIACGLFAARRKIIDSDGQTGLNLFVYYFALPVLTFSLMANADLRAEFQGSFVAAYAFVAVVLFAASAIIARFVFRLSGEFSIVFATGSIYGNTGYFGLPFVVIAFGQQASVPMVICTTIDLAIMLPLASVLLERVQAESTPSSSQILRQAVESVLKNPLIIAAVLGAVFSLSGASLPEVADRFVVLLGSAAAPCALFALGCNMDVSRASLMQYEVFAISLIKLAVHPLLVWFAMFSLFEVDPSWGEIAVIAASMPVAVTAYVLAQRFGTYVGRTSASILLSTVVSVASLSLVLSLIS